ncbi:MAG: helix-turn-helix domain-containing protein [Proteobacteria bacterium]|nr:helix-turn-helix domain-containing protein [Pseudomonadota bacterium]
MTNSVGQRVRSVRGERGVGEFADSLGVNRKTVTRWEADEALPDGASLLALHERFGANPGWLLTGAGQAPTNETLSADERELLALFRAAPLAVKAAAIGALQGAAGAGARYEGSHQVFNSQVENVAGRDIVKTNRKRRE